MMKVSFSENFFFTLSILSAATKNNSSNSRKFLCQISHFTTFSPNSASAAASYPSRRHEEESRNVKVSVWWDFENCHLPAGANVYRVAQFITAAIRANGIRGPMQITAFGDVLQLSRLNQEALSATGISLAHVPRGGKNSADRSLLVDLMYWVSQNPPPAHLFLISGDRDFAGVLHRLRMSNYNILLASIDSAPSVLCSAASIMWNWNSLLKGESLSGKHFNQPPDGPYGSWYGHYRAPLEDPFAFSEQPVCPRVEELPDSGLVSKVRPIPEPVIRQIFHILYSYPKGIPITELRAELSKSNLNIDKDLYGYKKFSRFLLAMPQILKLQPANDGQFLVHNVPQKVPEHNREQDSVLPLKLNGEKSFSSQHVEKSTLPGSSETPMQNAGKLQFPSAEDQKLSVELQVASSPEGKVGSPSVKLQEPTINMQEQRREVREPPSLLQVVDNAKATENELHMVEERSPVFEPGFLKTIWRKWFRHKENIFEQKNCSEGNGISPEQMKTAEKTVKLSINTLGSVDPTPLCPSSGEAKTDSNILTVSGTNNNKTRKTLGFFGQVLSRVKFWRSSTDSDHSSEELRVKTNQVEGCSHANELFAKESFWDELVAFLDTPEAAAVVMQSRTRMQMMQNLQKQGPPVLRSLSEDDLHRLANLMISDKKWIEESPSDSARFKLIRTDEKVSFGKLRSNPRPSNGLSSIFSNTEQPFLSGKRQEPDGHKKHQNPPDASVYQPVIEGKPSGKSRNEILSDCQKLIDEIVKEYPQGFKMSCFRKLFLEKNGYSLDLPKLGFRKLAYFLQTLHGVQIVSTYIVPSHKVQKNLSPENLMPFVQEGNLSQTEANSESELSDSSGRDDDVDCPWEELGPVANSGTRKSERGSILNRKTKDETKEKIQHDYESLSDDDFSDSEETLSSMDSRSKKKPRINDEDSSLLQILDSWYSSKEHNRKEDDNKRDASDLLDGVADTSGTCSNESGTAGSLVKHEIPVVKKQRPLKSYSFVAEQPVDTKDSSIDGILGSLKKAGETSSEPRM